MGGQRESIRNGCGGVLLICETHALHEVAAKLTPGEFERVVELSVGRRTTFHLERWPRSRSTVRYRQAGRNRIVSRPISRADSSTKPQSGKECGSIGNLFGIALDQASLRWAAAEGVTETVIAAGLVAPGAERGRDHRQAYAGRASGRYEAR